MKTYNLTEINADTITASDRLAESRLEGKQRYHHLMCRPYPEDGEDDNKGKMNGFAIEFPCMLTSSIYELVDPISGDRHYHLFAEVYARYGEIYQRVSEEIDAMLVDCLPELRYEPLLFVEMNEKRGYKLTLLERCCAKVGREVDEELFRHLMLSFLIPTELAKEEDGTKICEGMAALKQTYCDSLDSRENRATKQKIYDAMDLPMEDSTDEHVDDVVQWHRYPHNHPTMANRIDYSKSPQISFKLMVSKPVSPPKQQSGHTPFIIPETQQVIWTWIHDCISFVGGAPPITNMTELETFLHRKDEWLCGSKEPFKLLQKLVVNTPCVHWFKGNGKAVDTRDLWREADADRQPKGADVKKKLRKVVGEH